jgi:metal-responsive CopG/Arc/MetJ family transcriptional regulator
MLRILTVLLITSFTTVMNAQDSTDDEHMEAYIVIADTSQTYSKLRSKMLSLSKKLEIKIDTMGRSFNSVKKLICLPENDEDELYAGYYFPRRYPSEVLSLEYLNYYTNDNYSTENTIALVTIITDDKAAAEKNLAKVKKYSKNAFVINVTLYMGCMH